MRRKQCHRLNYPGDAHELTFFCYQRLPLLIRDRTRRWLIEAIEEARSRLRFDLWAYVVIPEHVHILLYPREPEYEIARILWRIKRPVARQAIVYLKDHALDWMTRLTVTRSDGTREHRFWQAGGGYDRNIFDETTALRVIEYIHLNPVRRGLVTRPEDRAWSSARWYAGMRPVPLEIDPSLPGMFES